jgi:hypothetical protein
MPAKAQRHPNALLQFSICSKASDSQMKIKNVKLLRKKSAEERFAHTQRWRLNKKEMQHEAAAG